MAIYRFFKMNSGKRVAAPTEERELDGDTVAIMHAKSLASGHAIGVWQGARLVANVESHDCSYHSEPQFTAHRAS